MNVRIFILNPKKCEPSHGRLAFFRRALQLSVEATLNVEDVNPHVW